MKDNKEIQLLKKKGYIFIDDQPAVHTTIDHLIVFVHDTRTLHDSGYPFIKIFGYIGKNKVISLGWHDHYIINCAVNVDALGKNVLRISRWSSERKFWIRGNNLWCSSFEIREDGQLR